MLTRPSTPVSFPARSDQVGHFSISLRSAVVARKVWGESMRARSKCSPTAHWTRLSCHRFRANEVRLQLSVFAYNLGNLWRRLVLPKRIDTWSLTSAAETRENRGRSLKHARYCWLLLAESSDPTPVHGELQN